MATATLTITYGDVPGFPAGTVLNAIIASLTETSVTPPVSTSQKVPPGTPSIVFTDVDPGTYTMTVNGVDPSGAVLGSPFTGTFTITAPTTVTLSLPASVTVAQT